jgi:Mrp family chromosome partitioning ATPase
MSRIQEILARAERDGTARRTRGDEAPPSPPSLESAGAVDARPLFPRGGALGTSIGTSLAPATAAPATLMAPAVTPAAEPRPVHTTLHPALIAAIDPHSSAAEQYRAVRTRLSLLEETTPVRVVLVTSPGAREGKSITAANLALTMAQEFQRNVLLLDADLRGSSIHQLFGVDSHARPGRRAHRARRRSTRRSCMLPDYRLTLLPAGGHASQFPTELLGSTTMRRTLDTLRARFDRVLLDLPPVMPLADVGTVAPLADGVLMVVRAGVDAAAGTRPGARRVPRGRTRPRPAAQRRAVDGFAAVPGSGCCGPPEPPNHEPRTAKPEANHAHEPSTQNREPRTTRDTMQLFNRYVSPRGLTVFGFEILLIFGSVAIAARAHGVPAGVAADLWKIALVTGLCQICFYYNDLYDLTVVHSSRELLIRLLQAAGAASIIIAVLYLLVPSLAIGNGIIVSSLVIFLTAIVAWRLLFNRLAYTSHLEERVLIVGSRDRRHGILARQIQHQPRLRLPRGRLRARRTRARAGVLNTSLVGTAGRPAAASSQAGEVDRIVVALTDRRGRLPIAELLHAKLLGVQVEDATTMYERLTGKILIDDLKPSWLIFGNGFVISRRTRFVKRSFDILLASIGVIAASPLMLITALAVYLDSEGPIFYCQERVGENGRPFTLFKFRSMRTDAEQDGTPVWAADNDDRVTRVGRFIRMSRLDELPQLWNVLRG